MSGAMAEQAGDVAQVDIPALLKGPAVVGKTRRAVIRVRIAPRIVLFVGSSRSSRVGIGRVVRSGGVGWSLGRVSFKEFVQNTFCSYRRDSGLEVVTGRVEGYSVLVSEEHRAIRDEGFKNGGPDESTLRIAFI